MHIACGPGHSAPIDPCRHFCAPVCNYIQRVVDRILKVLDKLQNPMTTPSGRKVTIKRRKKKKMLLLVVTTFFPQCPSVVQTLCSDQKLFKTCIIQRKPAPFAFNLLFTNKQKEAGSTQCSAAT